MGNIFDEFIKLNEKHNKIQDDSFIKLKEVEIKHIKLKQQINDIKLLINI